MAINKPRLCFTATVVCALVSLCGGVLWSWGTSDYRIVRSLAADTSSLSFGSVPPQRHFRWALRLQNNSDRDIVVDQLKASCQCTLMNAARVVVPGDGSADIELKLDLATSATESQPFAVNIAGVVVDEAGDSIAPVTWKITGTINRSLLFEKPALVFLEDSNHFIPDHFFDTQSVGFTSTYPLKEILVHAPPQYASVSAQLTSPSTGIVEITPRADLPAGPFEFEVLLQGLGPSGEQVTTGFYSVRGISLHDIFAVPDTIVIRPSELGHSESTTVVLQSRTNRSFSVKPVAEDGDIELAADGVRPSHRMRIRTTVAHLGAHREEVVLETITEDLVRGYVVIPITYIGTQRVAK